MKTDNELIAEFMGFVLLRNSHEFGNLYYHPIIMGQFNGNAMPFKYDTSWDWLMPVVEKIGDLYIDHPGRVSDFMRLTIGSHIQEIYKEIVEFIKWYNSQH